MDEKIKIVIQGKEYTSLEDVPEEYRPLIEAQLKAAVEMAAKGPGQNISVKKTFTIKLGESKEQGSPITPGANLIWLLVPLALLAWMFYRMFF